MSGLSLDNIVQPVKTGTFTGFSGTASLDAGTTADTTIVLFVGLGGDNVNSYGVATPAGFTLVHGLSVPDYSHPWVFVKPRAAADETSWALTITGSAGTPHITWAVLEISNVDTDWTNNVYLSDGAWGASTPASTFSVGTSTASQTFDGLSIVGFYAASADTTPVDFTGYDNLFFEIASDQIVGASRAYTLGVAAKQQQVVGTVACQASMSPDGICTAALLVLTGLDSHHAPTVTAMCGMEVGTNSGLATPSLLAPAVFDEIVGTPEIVTTNARSGSYCLKLSSTSAAESAAWTRHNSPRGILGQTTDNPITMWTGRKHFRFDGTLPSINVELMRIEAGTSGNSVVWRYVAASQRIGCKVGGGSEVLSDAAPPADKHFGLDIEYDPRTTTHTCRWAVDYNATPGDTTDAVPQTTATNTGMTAAGVNRIRYGWGDAITATVYIDDLYGTKHRLTYPIGPVEIVPVKVDPAGTPTVTGDSGDFRVYSGGAMNAWTPDGTRNALDDVPPGMSPPDGLAQVNVATGKVTIPMDTVVCAPDSVPLAGRWYIAVGSINANPASMVLRGLDSDGQVWSIGQGQIDWGVDDTTLIWVTQLHYPNQSPPNALRQLTQTRINGLALEFGESTDANPDIYIHSVLVEVARQPVVVIGVTDAEGGLFTVYSKQDRYSGTIAGFLVTTPAGTRGATFGYTKDGTETSQHVAANTAQPFTVAADTVAQVSGYWLVPDQAT